MASLILERAVTARQLNGGRANLDALGIFYVLVAILYSLLVAVEIYLLHRHRSNHSIRIRGFSVLIGSVSMLHVYLVLVLLAYPENGNWPCVAEYWIMSVFLPLGMALFQAANARLLKYYESQERLARNYTEGARKKRITWTPKGILEAYLRLDAAAKTYAWIVVGLAISFIPSTILYFGSRRFHRSYGFFGHVADQSSCRRGAEWVPSIFMQLFWTTIFGPYLLWKIRKVNDVHYWAWQTRLAIIAGLPGTPLWLAFTYTKIPVMLTINKYFPTSGWFLPCLITIQQVTIILPLWDAYKSALNPSRRTSTSSLTSHISASSSATLKHKGSMQSLEFVIKHNIEPLITWAARREFTAENMVFLREVRNFRQRWEHISEYIQPQTQTPPTSLGKQIDGRTEAGPSTISAQQRRQQFTEASLIFFTLINPFTAETPINIEYKVFRHLQSLFSSVVFDPYECDAISEHSKRENVVCPWEDDALMLGGLLGRAESVKSESGIGIEHVPKEFDVGLFDAAFESIKYLVFTNTWPRYVEAERASGVMEEKWVEG
ncbi:uncharacterized protein BDZ99DRAFT_457588 [Mytilinidion resinicola]|uniref:RGS domain-containing protein n=1 Tax=Mytilinidion resinicola TaxID=574789 RepID=A0A6A6Z3A1_9PEZI|nr:uncharacterized protein BDZ99DRAFT_457588 [Mytilinidion resinicola]KAF2815611.1 hypothetical protein BDZ99DRAFT_457588 [Mytilinidion resinicola]